MTTAGGEFAFELRVCRWAELAWPPGEATESSASESSAADSVDGYSGEAPGDASATDSDSRESPAVLVGRQVGTRDRRWDTVVIESSPEQLQARATFGSDTLDSDLLHIVRNAPAEWAWYQDALPDPGYPWRYVRAAVHRAAARGVVEKRRNGNRIEIRRIAPYPSWVNRLIAIENKPDLDASAASALAEQIAHDVDVALADEVWVATARTGGHVERALLTSFPVEAGVLTFDFSNGVHGETGTVEWLPSRLDPGLHSNGQADTQSGMSSDPEIRRLELAERAYGRGWRSFHDTMRPDCRAYELRRDGRLLHPWCTAKAKEQTAAECSGSCSSFSPEPPAWRTNGWPISGGPGKGLTRLLTDRREWIRSRARSEDE